MRDPEGEAWLLRIAEGDQAAMMRFYDRFFGLVAGYCRRMLPDRELADEVIQDVFMRVWRSAERFDPERAGVATWLLVIARSRSVDALRVSRRTVSGDSWEELAVPPAAPDDVAEEAAGRLEQESVRRAVAGLPDTQREALTMVYLEGLSGQEAAQRQQVPLGTLKTRLRLGLEKLRQVVGGDANGS